MRSTGPGPPCGFRTASVRDGAIRVGSVMLRALLTSPVVCRTDAQRDYRFGWSDWRMAWATLQSHMAMLRFAFRDDLRRGVE